MSSRVDLPPRLRTALSQPSRERQPWSSRLAGVLIASFLWVAYPDLLAAPTLAVGGLLSAVFGAALGGLFACTLLFLPSAMQGLRTRQPLMVVATSAFGVRGSALVPGLLLGLVQILWFAVAVHYAVEFNLRGLLAAGLIDPEDIRSAQDDWQIHRSAVYGASVLLWGMASALVATRFIRWIAALMVVYPIFIALALAGAMLWAIPGLPEFESAAAESPAGRAWEPWPAFWAMSQLVFGFSATVAAQSVNWGATLRGRRDVVNAGVVGVGLAPAIVATIALLTVAGSLGREIAPPAGPTAAEEAAPHPMADPEPVPDATTPPGPRLPDPIDTESYSLGAVFERRIGGIGGAIALIVMGLGSLATAVYAAYSYSNRLEAIRSRPRRWAWGVVGAVVALPLMTTGLAGNVPLVIDLTSGVLAPMLGVLTADLVLHRSSWPGPRPGIRPAGMVGWALGSLVGLLPALARIVPLPEAVRWLPMAVAAYLLGFLVASAIEGFAGIRGRAGRPSPAVEPRMGGA